MLHYFTRLKKQIIDNWDRKALCNVDGESFTFGQTAVQIERFHLFFDKLNIRKGEKIAICAKNQARWAVSFLSINTYEAVAVPILADFTPDNICYLVEHSESVMLFTDPDIWNKLDIAKMPSVKRVVSVSDFSLLYASDEDKQIFSSLDKFFYEKYPAGLTVSDINYPTDNDTDLSVINYTSGSTGDPKGVMLRYECFSANVDYGQKFVPSYPGDNVLSILPMAHMFGLVFELIYPLCGGAAINYLGKTPSPTVLLKAMKQVKPYVVIAVPMIFEKIYKSKLKPELEKKSVKVLTALPFARQIVYSKMRSALDDAFGGNVREYIMGGAAVNPEVEAFLQKIGFHFMVGYGMTEAAPLLAYSPWKSFVLRSCGKAMDYVSLRIDSEDPEHIVGEIQAKGVSIFSGYFKNEKATSSSFTKDGWFNTGDLGLIDSRGNVYIKGRSKNLLLSSSGQNIYPEELECELNNQPYVIESVVVSRDSRLVALLYLDDAAINKNSVIPADVAEQARVGANAKLPKFSQIATVEIQEEPFQKTPKMSIKRFLYK